MVFSQSCVMLELKLLIDLLFVFDLVSSDFMVVNVGLLVDGRVLLYSVLVFYGSLTKFLLVIELSLFLGYGKYCLYR